MHIFNFSIAVSLQHCTTTWPFPSRDQFAKNDISSIPHICDRLAYRGTSSSANTANSFSSRLFGINEAHFEVDVLFRSCNAKARALQNVGCHAKFAFSYELCEKTFQLNLLSLYALRVQVKLTHCCMHLATTRGMGRKFRLFGPNESPGKH